MKALNHQNNRFNQEGEESMPQQSTENHMISRCISNKFIAVSPTQLTASTSTLPYQSYVRSFCFE
jgi:hypothetical protein